MQMAPARHIEWSNGCDMLRLFSHGFSFVRSEMTSLHAFSFFYQKCWVECVGACPNVGETRHARARAHTHTQAHARLSIGGHGVMVLCAVQAHQYAI